MSILDVARVIDPHAFTPEAVTVVNYGGREYLKMLRATKMSNRQSYALERATIIKEKFDAERSADCGQEKNEETVAGSPRRPAASPARADARRDR